MLKPASIFSNDMVLQRDKNIAVWGRGENGRTVSVSINGISRRGIVRDGEWNVTLPPMAAGGDYEMTVTDGTDTVTFYRVAVGEVWLCGGQSNMELELQNAKGGKEILETLTPDCGVRFYYTQKNGCKNEKFYHDEENSAWSQAGKEQSRAWSAVGFHFGVKLAKELGVTVGLIGCNWGGTSASAWVDRQTLEADSRIRSYIDEYDEKIKGKSLEEQEKEYSEYEEYDRKWHEKEAEVYKSEPGASWDRVQELCGKNLWPGPMCELNPFRPAGLYHTMLMRVCPYTLRGFLYYQGESDDHKPDSYYELFSALIKLWRTKWGDDDLPFVLTQLPMFKYKNDPDYKHWAKIRSAQDRAFRTVKNTGMAVILDCGELDNIHPTDKKPVGERLCLQAESLAYGMDVDAFGPMLERAVFEDGKAVLTLKYNDGLEIRGDGSGFELAGEDGEFRAAKAQIKDGRVILTSDEVSEPVYAAYCWTNYGEVNVYNKAGIPLAPFNTLAENHRR